MRKIKLLVNTKILPEQKHKFEKENIILSLSHIKVICLTFVMLSVYFLYADLAIKKSVNNEAFKITLYTFHAIGFIICVLFILFYKNIRNNFSIDCKKFIIRGAVFLLLLMGSLSSINSQRLTGNIDAYIIFTIIAAVAFPFEPIFMLFSFLTNHIIVMVGMILSTTNHDWLVTKQINSSALTLLSILLCCSLYKQRVFEFTTRYTLSKSKANFKKLFSVNPIPLFISTYEEGRIIRANDRAYNFYGYSKKEFHKICAKNLYKNEDDRAIVLSRLNSSDKVENFIVEQKTKLGNVKWVIANYEAIEYNGENCVLTCVTDITEIKKMENELLDHASTDTLTGVLNRRTGMEILKDRINVSKQHLAPLVICFIDIDGLKYVNDNFGHNEGDFLINKVASILRNNISASDVLFRYGGDEFVILFSDRDKQFAEDVWNKIISEFNKSNDENLRPYQLGASHGLFEYNGDSDLTLEEILDSADKSMYFEKNINRANR